MIGIYAIRQKDTGRCYVGSSMRVSVRWTQHRRQLRLGIHPNSYLQRAWTKHGESAFEFVLLESVDGVDALKDREQVHLDSALSTLVGVFNVGLVARSPRRGVPISPEHRAAVRAWRPSDETRARMRAAAKTRYMSPEHKAKLAAHIVSVRPGKGFKRSEAAKARMAEAARLSWLNGKRRSAHEVANAAGL